MKYFTLNNAMFKKRYFSTYEHSYSHLQNLCYVKIINNHFLFSRMLLKEFEKNA